MSSLDLKEFLAGYLIEVEEHLRGASRNLLDVERLAAAGQLTARPVRDLYRSTHTIKGLSAMIGVEPVVELAHAMEAVLRAADRGNRRLPPEALDLLVRGVRAIEARVAVLAAGAEVPAAPRSLVEGLVALAMATSAAAPGGQLALALPPELRDKIGSSEVQELAAAAASGRRAIRIDFVPGPERSERGLNITAVRERLGRLGELVKVVPLSIARSPEAPGGIAFALLLVSGEEDAPLAEAAGVDASEVVTLTATGAGGAHGDEESADDDALLPGGLLGDSGGVVRVPVARLDDALERLSALVITRFRLARATSALAASGVVSDDGRGIDRARLAERAGRPLPASAEELLALITAPGLTTRDEATTTSGRGLSMDIVRRIAVEELRGELALASEPGRGTRFTLRVPLTLTIVDAFSFSCAGQSFVVPVSMVDEIIDVDRARLRLPPAGPDRACAQVGLLDRRGEAVPMCELEACLALGDTRAGGKAILVRRNGRPFAFAVDRMLGQHEVVVRPVDDPLVRVDGISGCTDLGDGRPILVVDLLALSARMASPEGVSA
jgi:chemotaxis protein histidine kinase CheA